MFVASNRQVTRSFERPLPSWIVVPRRASVMAMVAAVAAFLVAADTARAQEPGPSERFHAAAAKALDAMAEEAAKRNMKGVAVVAFVPGEKAGEWSSRMRVVDSLVLGNANVLAIAYCKLSEMADTLRDSGSQVRPPLHGELGYKGGAIRKTADGWLLAAFSGGKDTDDLDVANVGLDLLEQQPAVPAR